MRPKSYPKSATDGQSLHDGAVSCSRQWRDTVSGVVVVDTVTVATLALAHTHKEHTFVNTPPRAHRHSTACSRFKRDPFARANTPVSRFSNVRAVMTTDNNNNNTAIKMRRAYVRFAYRRYWCSNMWKVFNCARNCTLKLLLLMTPLRRFWVSSRRLITYKVVSYGTSLCL